MSLTQFTKDMEIISKLEDEPNDKGDQPLSAGELKAKFDEGGLALKAYINDTLLGDIADTIDQAVTGSGFMPAGGAAGDFLTKRTGTDYEYQWESIKPVDAASGDQGLSAGEKFNARSNIGAAAAGHTHPLSDLTEIACGSWTPVVKNAVVNPGQSRCDYLRIGDIVCLSFLINATYGASSSTSNPITITGFPFVPACFSAGGGVLHGGRLAKNAGFCGFSLSPDENDTFVLQCRTCEVQTSAAGISALDTANEPGNGRSIILSGTIQYSRATA